MTVISSCRAASRTGCFPSPSLSTMAGTSALRWSLKYSPESTAAEERAWSAPWETRKLPSLRRSMQQSTMDATSAGERLFLVASKNWWRRSTLAILSLASLALAKSSASSIVPRRRGRESLESGFRQSGERGFRSGGGSGEGERGRGNRGRRIGGRRDGITKG